MTVFDMASDLLDLFIASSTAQVERNDAGIFVEGRSRRRRRRRRADETSSDESDGQPPVDSSAIFGKLVVDPKERTERMMEELDGHARMLRQGVERLAGADEHGSEASGVRATWRMLAFALEDWR